jgi:hypothetical protein
MQVRHMHFQVPIQLFGAIAGEPLLADRAFDSFDLNHRSKVLY